MDSTERVGNNIESKYKITITKNPPGGSAALLLTFSQHFERDQFQIADNLTLFYFA